MLVDDEPYILSSYRRVIRNKYEVVAMQSPREAVEALAEQGPFAVVISDYRMPEMDGVEFFALVKKISPDSVRIMLSGQADKDAAVEAVNEGNIFRFLNKPCPTDVFLKNIQAAVEQYELVLAERELLDNTLKGSIRVLIDILSIVSPVAFNKASRLPKTARKIAERLQLDKSWEIELAAMLSQIGCVTIPMSILKKREAGTALSPWEEKMYLTHAQQGKKLLANIPRLENIAKAIGDQFERYDDNRSSQQVSLLGRILKIVIDLDSLLQSGLDHRTALEAMRENYTWYDPRVFAALEAELMNVQEGYLVKSIGLHELAPGMVTADNVRDEKGVELILEGTEISDALYMRLMNYAKLTPIKEPIKILEMVKEAGVRS